MKSLFRKLLVLRFAQSFGNMFLRRHHHNRWKGLVLGTVGGLVGTLAMGYFSQAMAALTSGNESGGSDNDSDDSSSEWHALDDISLIGKHYKDGEGSTEAVGRITYQILAGKEPGDETKTAMSQIVHWSFGAANGALYGAARNRAGFPDASAGALFGASVWLFASELMIPLLGLSSGPTTSPVQEHATYLGAHLVYGVTTAATTQLLDRVL